MAYVLFKQVGQYQYMGHTELEETLLIGISLKHKTTNLNGQSGKDCGDLWQEFGKGGYKDIIPNKIGDEVLAVYHDYDGDHTQPYAYFIGCKVKPLTDVPEGMDSIMLQGGKYAILNAKGIMPGCVADAWKEIWASGMDRAYKTDFEVYDSRSYDGNNAEVDIYLSV